jgi:hypothetical protein
VQADRRDDRRRLLFLLPALLCFAWMSATTLRTHLLRDRWRRHDLADRYPAGGRASRCCSSTPATCRPSPRFAARNGPSLVRAAAVRVNLRWVEVPLSAGQKAEVRYLTLDAQASDVVHVVPLLADWFRTAVDVDEDGAVTSYSKKGGDSSPRRGLVWVDSEYSLPIRIDLPFEPHWRLSGDAAERRAWIGPGTADDSDQCAYEIGPPVSVTLRVPRRPDFERVLEVGAADPATRLTMKPDGTVDRDAIPLWRRVSQVATF